MEVATSQPQLHLDREIWIQYRRSFRLHQIKTECHQADQQLNLLHLRRMAQLLIKLAFIQADFATLHNLQICKRTYQLGQRAKATMLPRPLHPKVLEVVDPLLALAPWQLHRPPVDSLPLAQLLPAQVWDSAGTGLCRTSLGS